MTIRDNTVLITGASKGIGLASAQLLSQRGFNIVGLARSVLESGFPGDFYDVDLSDRDSSKELLEKLRQDYQFSGLVNNVGAVGAELLEEVKLETVDHVYQVNVGAAILCAQCCIPSMRAHGWGRIINISSELALGLPTRTAYGGAKAALLSMTRTWALELARNSITVNAIAPGPVETELFISNNPPGGPEYQRKLERIPLGGFAQPEDIANVVDFFMSKESDYITGQTLHVDGGSTLASNTLF